MVQKTQIKRALFVQHKDIKTMAKDIAHLREQDAIGERERITNLQPTGQGVISTKQDIPREIPQEEPKIIPQEEKVLQEEVPQESPQKIPQIDENIPQVEENMSDKPIKASPFDAIHKIQKQELQSEIEGIQGESLDKIQEDQSPSLAKASVGVSDDSDDSDDKEEEEEVMADKKEETKEEPSASAKDFSFAKATKDKAADKEGKKEEVKEEPKEETKKDWSPGQAMEDRTKKAAEEIEERWEEEAKRRVEEQKKTIQQKQIVVEDRENEKILLIENRKYFEKELQIIPDEKKPLVAERKLLLIKIDEIKQSIEPTLRKEKQIEEEKQVIEKKEKLTTSSEDKKEVEKERWNIEEKRAEIEKQRWEQEGEIGKVEVEIREINSKFEQIIAKEKKAVEKIDNITKQLEILKLRDEKFILEKSISEPSTKGEDLKWKIKELSETKRQTEEILSDDVKKEIQIEELIKIIEKEEAEAKTREERQTIEKKRAEMEKERREIEKQRWDHEDEKKKIALLFKKSELEYKTISDKEKYLATKLKKIEELLQTKHTEIGKDGVQGLKSLEELGYKSKEKIQEEKEQKEREQKQKEQEEQEEKKQQEEQKEQKERERKDEELKIEEIRKEMEQKIQKEKEEQEGKEQEQREQERKEQEQEQEQEKKRLSAIVSAEALAKEEALARAEKEKAELMEGIKKKEQEDALQKQRLEEKKIRQEKEEQERKEKEELEQKELEQKELEQKELEQKERERKEQEEHERRGQERKEQEKIEALKSQKEEEEKKGQKEGKLEQETIERSEIMGTKSEKREDERMLLLPKPLSSTEKVLIRIGITALLTLVIASIILFFYWYFCVRNSDVDFFLRPQNTEEAQVVDFEEIMPPLSLFPIETVLTLEIENLESLQQFFSGFLEQNFEEKKFSRVLIKDLSNNTFLDIENFFNGFQINPPENFYDKIAKDFTLFVYNSGEQEIRIGFVVKIDDKQGFSDLMKSWEPLMEEDFEGLFVLTGKQGPALTPDFRDAVCCGGKTIRYQTFSEEDLGICYSVLDDFFVFSGSWESIEQAINNTINEHYNDNDE